jgi:hypothetical protein
MDEGDAKRRKSNRRKLAIVGLFLPILVSLLAIWTQLNGVNEQLSQQAKISSAQYVLNLSAQLNGPEYANILNAIEANPHTYSPLKAGFTQVQLEDYMSQFETIGDLLNDGVITEEMAYDEFSYDAEKAYCNEDVWNDIVSDRHEDGVETGTDAFWYGFQSMSMTFLAQDRLVCSSTRLDNQ